MADRPATEPRPVAIRWAETWHDIQCGIDHPLSDHEPFDTDESDISWTEIEEAAERNGLRFIAIEAEAAQGIQGMTMGDES